MTVAVWFKHKDKPRKTAKWVYHLFCCYFSFLFICLDCKEAALHELWLHISQRRRYLISSRRSIEPKHVVHLMHLFGYSSQTYKRNFLYRIATTAPYNPSSKSRSNSSIQPDPLLISSSSLALGSTQVVSTLSSNTEFIHNTTPISEPTIITSPDTVYTTPAVEISTEILEPVETSSKTSKHRKVNCQIRLSSRHLLLPRFVFQ